MGIPPVTRLDGEPTARLHHRAFLFDGHNDVALEVLRGGDIASRRDRGHLDLPRMREGGFDGGVFAVWIDPELPDPWSRSLSGVSRLREYLEATPGFHPVLTAADLDVARVREEIAAVIGVEGGYGVSDDLEAVDRLHDAGMRCLTLTWMRPTKWADASGAAPVHDGLSAFGQRVVDRLRTLGVAIDISHAADRVAEQLLSRGDGPIIASHSGVRAVSDHHRNLSDALLERLAAADGVIGINFFSAYLDAGFGREVERLKNDLGPYDPERHHDLHAALADRVAAELEPVPLELLIDHLEHAVRVAGPRHVGLGSDFDGVVALPEGLEDVRGLPRVTDSLARRGVDAESLEAVLGGNFLRFFRTVLS
jgi:membrane dipeptidase